MQQLENDLDQTQEKLMNANQRLEEKEKALQHKNSQRLLTLPTNLNVCARCSRTEACQMRRGWKLSKTNLKKPDSWLKKPTENTMRLQES